MVFIAADIIEAACKIVPGYQPIGRDVVGELGEEGEGCEQKQGK